MISLFSDTKSKNAPIKQEIIFVIGGPGSGKGTHSAILEKTKGYCHISSGDLVRNILAGKAEGSAENQKHNMIRETIKNGQLLDDQMIIDMVHEEIKKHPDAPGFLIDGCPRTMKQLGLFEKLIKPCDKALFFDVSDEEMKKRVLARGQEQKRADDNEVTMAKRLDVYKKETLPIVEYLEKYRPTAFKRINSTGTIEDVSAQVMQAMTDAPVAQKRAFAS